MIDGWKLVKAVDFINFNPKEKLEKGAITKKISMEQLYPFTRDIFSYELAPFSGGSKFRNGDTLMARITPCLENGKTSQVNILDNEEIGFGSTEFIVLREIPNVSDRNFIYYLAISSILRDKAIKSMVGSSGRQRVQQGVINDIEFFVPPLDEQKRIASILSALDDKIELNKKINKTLEEMAKAIFKSWFVDFEPWGGKMPDDWKEGILGYFVNICTGKLNANAQVINGKYPFFTCADKPLKIDKYDFDTEAIIISGNGSYVGYMHYYTGRFNAYQRTYVITDFKIPVQFIWLFLKMNLHKRVATSVRGSSMPYIVLDTIRDLPVILPNQKILNRFSDYVRPILKKIMDNDLENIHLFSLRDTLLPKLMSGEIRVK